jgi:uncharacterized membrane protein YkoI
MFRRLPAVLILALTLAATSLPGSADMALAQGCLSSREARSAVQSGQAAPLSKMLKQIKAATGGEILPTPQLCNSGGQLVYIVKVLKPDGQVEKLTVNAASGSILGY